MTKNAELRLKVQNPSVITFKIELIPFILMGKEKNFYYYEVFLKDTYTKNDINPVELFNKFDKCIFNLEDIKTNSEQTLNEFDVQALKNGFYGGRIIRSELVKGLYGVKSSKKERVIELDGNIPKEIKGVGNKRKDIVHFIIKPKNKRIYFIVEAGFQSIGMPKLLESIETSFKKEYPELKTRYEAIPKGRKDIDFTDIEKGVLKKVIWRFKKSFENLPKEVKLFEESQKEFFPPEFAVRLEITASRLNKNAIEKLPKVGTYLAKVFGVGSPKALNKLDFTNFLEDFRFEYFDEDDEIQTEDILNKYLKVTLELNQKLEPERVFNELIKDFETHQEVEEE
ncbi:MAG: hypothetical protein BWY04_01293 [candidate division CPR1 bacterium ADurb.Bin160]|uniref:Uncharacterized protein n=1 Tax=candidate division CPR1 bacterium ADurb.Bin160 TaxID=1852826 RepID=A0A1V5ZKI5_9BACT|nr:MAG: hypothetical protein BWY04_01293 [candidate division CPR1 bacterium ADurb.Bin160]